MQDRGSGKPDSQDSAACIDTVREATWESQGFRFPVTRNPAKEKLFVEVRDMLFYIYSIK